VSTRTIDFEGFSAAEILALSDSALDAWIFSAEPIVFKAGSAHVLGEFAIEGARLVAGLAHIDGGGEGVLPAITSVLTRLAKRRGLEEIEWLVYATNCARPNPKLRRVLEWRGFAVVEHETKGAAYRLLETL